MEKREQVRVGIVNKSNNPLPKYGKPGDSGMDIRAFIPNELIIPKGKTTLIHTGLYFDIPDGYEIQVRSRSGLSLKYQIIVENQPGTIDSCYTGELGIIIRNEGENDFAVYPGDKIAQIVLQRVPEIIWKEISSEEIKETDRGANGYGSTGIN